jgi:hypothetical protein
MEGQSEVAFMDNSHMRFIAASSFCFVLGGDVLDTSVVENNPIVAKQLLPHELLEKFIKAFPDEYVLPSGISLPVYPQRIETRSVEMETCSIRITRTSMEKTSTIVQRVWMDLEKVEISCDQRRVVESSPKEPKEPTKEPKEPVNGSSKLIQQTKMKTMIEYRSSRTLAADQKKKIYQPTPVPDKKKKKKQKPGRNVCWYWKNESRCPYSNNCGFDHPEEWRGKGGRCLGNIEEIIPKK